MSDDRLAQILEAARSCFARHGVRRTTMDDIAAAAGMSRAAVYQYVRNKDDAFRRLATQLFDNALTEAKAVAASDGPLVERLHGVLAVKLELALQLSAESPHAEELLGATSQLSGELVQDYTRSIHGLVAEAIDAARERGELPTTDIAGPDAADIALAMLTGLEENLLAEPEVLRRRFRQSVELLVTGLSSQVS